MNFDALIQTVAIAALPVLFAITLHEAAHGYVARHFGDMTAYQQGRISLNPLKHIDPLGTILLPIMTLWIGGILFGWAKPVPVNFAALRRPKQDMLWVALAGPLANLFMALCWGIWAKIALSSGGGYFAQPLLEMAQIGIKINIILMVLNLLPLPPLDGGRIVVSMLPYRAAYKFAAVEPYGMFILIGLAVTPILGWILTPPIFVLIELINLIFGF